jgi:hypothetical protein
MWRVQAVHVVNSSSRDACGAAVSRAGPLLILDNGVGSGVGASDCRTLILLQI